MYAKYVTRETGWVGLAGTVTVTPKLKPGGWVLKNNMSRVTYLAESPVTLCDGKPSSDPYVETLSKVERSRERRREEKNCEFSVWKWRLWARHRHLH